MRYADRRAIEAEIQYTRRTISKMEKALDGKIEDLRKLTKALEDDRISREDRSDADRQPTHPSC